MPIQLLCMHAVWELFEGEIISFSSNKRIGVGIIVEQEEFKEIGIKVKHIIKCDPSFLTLFHL